ncbi:Legionella vir region protein LvrA [Legionella donaldsonii]|uniref:Legionella vir region protein LvrA n=1 Tax=Legionella donaldsonii TaxID=45060 RepID=A0A378KNH0_9GAMM|nr:hypothetical protein [Legionella donaldsonii]STX84892.1 Legionella vir region protein LvrA [Legionella donaldsonii]
MEIEAIFNGLPHVHTTLIKSLITLANPETGVVENLSYRDLAILLSVHHAPGRRGAGIPKKETIRSYFRTIAENHPDDFRLISQGQKLKCHFPKMPAIYAHFITQEKLHTVQHSYIDPSNYKESFDTSGESKRGSSMQLLCECPTEEKKSSTAKNININNINNNNNKAWLNKQPITRSFTPTRETIETAHALGFHDAHKPEVIADFIAKNKAWGSAFADYQPVYLNFLVRRAERLQLNKKTQPPSSGRDFHADSRQPKARSLTPSERVIRAYASEFDYCERTGQFFDKGSLTQSIDGFVMEAAL